MRGAVAAGHEVTAQAGARALEEGGNAVDACIAAAFASWVAESPLTGPGAGGFMLVHRAQDRSRRLLDFFVAAPGQGRPGRAEGEMDAVDIPFEGSDTTQRFLIGHASCAVPGTVAGLAAAHRSYGTMPWQELVAPAIELARDGVVMTKAQALLHALLDSILRHTPEGRAVYGGRARLVAGDRLVAPDLATTLEMLAAEGPDAIYRGDLGAAIAAHVQEHGGAITRRDLETYRVIRRRPVEVAYRGHVFESNPPPSSGGVLIGYGLALLDRAGRARRRRVCPGAGARPGGCCVSRRVPGTSASRASSIAAGLRDACCRRARSRLLRAGSAVGRSRRARHRAGRRTSRPWTPRAMPHHCRRRRAPGSGVVVPGTGIHMNNMLGEYDLQPGGRAPKPGTRLTSMMAPSMVSRAGEPRLVLGSAGSVRLRGAVMQVVINVVDHGLSVSEAIDSPRVHVDGEHVHCEGGHDPSALDELADAGLRRRALAAEESLLRRRRRRRAQAGRHARGGRRSTPRRPRHRRRRVGASPTRRGRSWRRARGSRARESSQRVHARAAP